MRGVIIYTSRYGATEEYARWLGEDTGYPVVNIKKTCPSEMENADTIVVGSNVRIGRIEAGKWLQQNWPLMEGKRVILFSVGIRANDDAEVMETLNRSLPEAVRAGIAYFAVPGRVHPDRLSFVDRQMLKMVARAEDDPAKKDLLLGRTSSMTRKKLDPVLRTIRNQEMELNG